MLGTGAGAIAPRRVNSSAANPARSASASACAEYALVLTPASHVKNGLMSTVVARWPWAAAQSAVVPVPQNGSNTFNLDP